MGVYGADDFLLNGMEAVEGSIDLEKLKTGQYILLSVDCNDDGTVIENPNISVGDTVQINHLKAKELSTTITDSYDFIIMAKVRANENTAATRNTGEARFYLPTEIFLPLCDNPHLVNFPFDVKEGTEAEMAEFLNSYTGSSHFPYHYHRRSFEYHHRNYRHRKLCQLRPDKRYHPQKGICYAAKHWHDRKAVKAYALF